MLVQAVHETAIVNSQYHEQSKIAIANNESKQSRVMLGNRICVCVRCVLVCWVKRSG
jgi:hypothetical protein